MMVRVSENPCVRSLEWLLKKPFLLCDSLTSLSANLFVFVTNSLALVRLRFSASSDFCSKLTDQLLVDSLDYHVCLIWTRDGESFGDRHLKFIGKSNAKLQNVFEHRCDVTDSDDFKLFQILYSHLQPCWRQAPWSGREVLERLRESDDRLTTMSPEVLSSVTVTSLWHCCSSFPSGPSTLSRRSVQGDLDAFGNDDRHFSDAGHSSDPSKLGKLNRNLVVLCICKNYSSATVPKILKAFWHQSLTL